jgi:tRNA (adenine37-N6)-methyltransferase
MNRKRDIICYAPIGRIKSPHTDPSLTPIQPCYAKGIKGLIELNSEVEEGLSDIEGFSHIFVIYHFHLSGNSGLKVKPFLDKTERGVFATRHPSRPNAIGISVLRLIERTGAMIHVSDIDILDGTPVLDIKPYIEKFDNVESLSHGWQDLVPVEMAQKLGKRADKKKKTQEKSNADI